MGCSSSRVDQGNLTPESCSAQPTPTVEIKHGSPPLQAVAQDDGLACLPSLHSAGHAQPSREFIEGRLPARRKSDLRRCCESAP